MSLYSFVFHLCPEFSGDDGEHSFDPKKVFVV